VRDALVSEDGFSLIETLVAMVLLVIAVVTLAQLFGIAARSNVASRDATYATVLAGQKLEEFLALDMGVVDTSPALALDVDTPGWVDYLDRLGRPLGGLQAPRQTAYVRRWSVERADVDGTWMIQVLVIPASPGHGQRGPAAVRLVTVRSRRTL
jgi:prepilin-type N-terminal cleavage/methylation domain-containing protein